MKKLLVSFSEEALSRDQMKKVSGGGLYIPPGGLGGSTTDTNKGYSCRCTQGPGTWIGYYQNAAAVGNAMRTYCTQGTGTTAVCTPL